MKTSHSQDNHAKWTKAYEILTEALAVSQRNGERRLRWRILACLVEIAQAQGRQGEADRYQKMGQEIVFYIADHAGSDELRASFLTLPEVQSLLQKSSPTVKTNCA